MSIRSKLCITVVLTLFFFQTTQTILKSLNQSCPCDITDNCDFQCCCDKECSQDLKTILYQYNRCGDDAFGIPLCQNINITDIHYHDLYSGLRTIYTIVKRLFCVQKINSVDLSLFYKKISSEQIITESTGRLALLQTSATLKPPHIASLPQKTINGLFYRSQLGLCVSTNSINSNLGTNGIQQCRALLTISSYTSNSFLSLSAILNSFPSINIYQMSQSSSITVTKLPVNTTTCSTNCSNIVKLLKIFINPQTNQVNQGLSYVIVGDLDNVLDNSYVMVKYDYSYLNSDGSIPNASNIGYTVGSYIQLLKYNVSSSKYYKMFNPINLAFRKPNGECRTANSDPSDQSLIQLKLGRNQFHTCIGDTSFIYNNLKNAFDYVGVMGSSNNVLTDFIQVKWSSNEPNPDSRNVLLKIFYTKIGSQVNPQYYILKISPQFTQNKGKQKTLFIQYQQVVTTASLYIPAPPKIDVYLPNDFLYPFLVVQ